MKRNDPAFIDALEDATVWLMEGFACWNDMQGELEAKGYPSNHYNEKEVAKERLAFRAIAERFVLEDVDERCWKWFETPWAGKDANTNGDAVVIDFIPANEEEDGLGILAFYVTCNSHYWYAIPLAEIGGPEGLRIYETNSIQAAIDAIELAPLS